MMKYLFILIWAALQIGFAHLFLAAFLQPKRGKEETIGLLVLAWLLTALFLFFDIGGLHGYLMYLLMVVMLLLVIYGEHSPIGLCLLVFAFIIPVVVDLAMQKISDSYLVITAGKLLPLGLALLLRRYRKPDDDLPKESDELLLRQHMEMQRESMSALEQSYRLQRKSAHEFEHHMQILRDLLDQNQVEAAREYLGRLKKNRSIHVMSVNSCHPVIDVILNQKYQTARENDIKMQIRVNDLSKVAIPTDDLVVVLTNLLDNAIEACRRIDGYREIFCSILYDDGLYISIRNTSPPVEIINGKIPTSKADSLSHGFGLMSVSHVMDKLHAEYTFGYDEGWFHFAAEIE